MAKPATKIFVVVKLYGHGEFIKCLAGFHARVEARDYIHAMVMTADDYCIVEEVSFDE